MNKIRHGVAALVLMGMVIGLFLSAYTDLSSYYNVVSSADQYSPITGETGNIMEQLDNLQLMQGMSAITNQILSIGSPDASFFDIVGGLIALGIGALQTIIGIAILPVEMGGILLEYYVGIPAIFVTGLGILFAVYLAFIILSAYLGKEV